MKKKNHFWNKTNEINPKLQNDMNKIKWGYLLKLSFYHIIVISMKYTNMGKLTKIIYIDMNKMKNNTHDKEKKSQQTTLHELNCRY